MTNAERSEKILKWRERIQILPDEQFMTLMRNYLGNIKTPYNKQKLMEQLGAFLNNEINKSNIIALLDQREIKILSVIRNIKNCTAKNIQILLRNSFSTNEIWILIEQLKNRLIVYEDKYEFVDLQDETVLKINPFLEELLIPYTSINKLICKKDYELKSNFLLSESFIMTFLCYVFHNPKMCRQNGEFKKKALTDLEEIFGQEYLENLLSLLCKSLKNLSVLYEADDDLKINFDELNNLLKLPYKSILLYLCAASQGHCTKKTLAKNGRVLAETLSSAFSIAGEKGFLNYESLSVLALIQRQKKPVSFRGSSRFSKMLAAHQNTNNNDAFDLLYIEPMLHAANVFGLICSGVDNEDFYCVNRLFMEYESSENEKFLSVDSAFVVTLIKNSSLKNLCKILAFLEPQKYSQASIFTISRKSIKDAFDMGLKAENCIDLLKNHSAYEIPQNLLISIEEWDSVFNSVSLYKGYVLKVTEAKAKLIKNSPKIGPHIVEELAPGIFILDYDLNESEIDFGGIEYVNKTSNSRIQYDSVEYPLVEMNFSGFKLEETDAYEEIDEKKADLIMDSLYKELEKIPMTQDQKECLESRIRSKIVVNPSQLNPDSVRFELLEASGMDFTGKIHVIENAVKKAAIVQITFEGNKVLLGKILSLSIKKTAAQDSQITFRSEKDGSILELFIAAIQYIKILR